MAIAAAVIGALLNQFIPKFLEKFKKELKKVTDVYKNIKELERKFKFIKIKLHDADNKQLENQLVKTFLDELKEVAYDLEDLLDEWVTGSSSLIVTNETQQLQWRSSGDHHDQKKMKEVCNSCLFYPCFCWKKGSFFRDFAGRINDIEGNLKHILEIHDLLVRGLVAIDGPSELPVQRSEDSHMVKASNVKGREEDTRILREALLAEVNRCDDKTTGCIPVIFLTGMSGVGKTTLAQLIFNDEKVKDHFKDLLLWVPVRNRINDKMRIAKEILLAKNPKSGDDYCRWPPLQKELKDLVEGKRFLIVLDNVSGVDRNNWTALQLALEAGSKGSIVLITSQNIQIANEMGSLSKPHSVNQLSDDASWLLLCHIALPGESKEKIKELESCGKELAKKCQGLPLAIESVGHYMFGKKSKQQWQDVLDRNIWENKAIQKELIPYLFFSYRPLTSNLRRCFSYCAFLPEDYPISKDNLIKLWMAQGFLGRTDTLEMEMEKTGEDNFNDLVNPSLLQGFKKDDNQNLITYKLHNLVYLLAQCLTQNECCSMETNTCITDSMNSTKIRHLTLVCQTDKIDCIPRYQAEKLRTLKLYKPISGPLTITEEYLGSFIRLRAFDLSCTDINVLSPEVDKLKLLRYLNLSATRLEKLPDRICNLYNLQTLILNDCLELVALPITLGKLEKLRHLEIQNTPCLRPLPKGIGRLTSLRTLSRFIVPAPMQSESSKFEELKDLNLLQGHLDITGLGRVEDKAMAEKAELKTKTQLRSLSLDFGETMNVTKEGVIEGVLEGLQPNPRLEKLVIRSYFGNNFPSWLTNDSILENLCILTLKDCKKCTQLPHLGKLPCLAELKIENADEVEVIGLEFYGIRSDNSNGCGEGTFLKLKKLQINGMAKLREWNWSMQVIVSMPSLTHLYLEKLPSLKTLKQNIFPPVLEERHISTCPGLLQTGNYSGASP